jgi:lipopolysaccharide/colanic/teichoic acid biosynthesis glycosyltransferase
MRGIKMEHKKGFYEKYIKRPLDFICALLACIVLSPVMLAIAILVKIKIGSPVLFTQERPGLYGHIFKLYKFRTMTNERDEKGELLPDAERLTAFGKMLRASSLDELPELISILVGDMSFIGPRPLLVRYLSFYSDEEKHRHDVRPGLSGWAQVNGRSFISWEDKFRLDIEYVNNISLFMDIKILFLSLKKFFDKSDVEDATAIEEDENGVKWCTIGEEKYRCYDAFDIERKKQLKHQK